MGEEVSKREPTRELGGLVILGVKVGVVIPMEMAVAE